MAFDGITSGGKTDADKPEDKDKDKKDDDKDKKDDKAKKSDTGIFKCFCICVCETPVFKANTRCVLCKNNIRHRKVLLSHLFDARWPVSVMVLTGSSDV